ncbi:MAG TPA: glycine cleavage T C-terminal barrel domain-containing protein [Rhizomicrobium sp.]|jgi:aminomethyltransferase
MSVRATPFHTRAAAANPGNSWITRNGFTLVQEYSGAAGEAMAARSHAILADITWRWRIFLEGPQAAAFLSRLTTRDAEALTPGNAHKALWLNDGGGLRGAGVIARYGRESFLLAAAAPDEKWIAEAAKLFDVRLRETDEGGLAIIGPYAQAIVTAAGLDASLKPLAFRKMFWRGIDVTLSRWGEHGGFEIWCNADDAVLVWDRIAKAGAAFGIQPAGTAATDILDMEAGVARPWRDYQPATDDSGDEPSPKALRLEKLIDNEHTRFNGRAGYLAASPRHRIAGIEFDCETAVPRVALYREGAPVGRVLISLYSPALQRAIGWAQVETSAAEPGTVLSFLPDAGAEPVLAQVAGLPFLSTPAPIAE